MNYSIVKKILAPQPVAVVRREIKPSEIAQALGEMFPQAFLRAQQQGLAPAGAPFCRYVAMGREKWTIEAGVPVAGGGQPDDTLPGGPAATTTHAGPYDKLREAHLAIGEWIGTEGLTIAGAPWESYVTDPGDYPDPKDWKTEVYFPVAG